MYPGLSSLGVPGVPWHTQILADQLTLFQPGGDRLCPPDYYWHTRIFRPSDGPGLPTGETGTTTDAHKFSETLTLSPTVGADFANHCRSQINFPVVMFLPIWMSVLTEKFSFSTFWNSFVYKDQTFSATDCVMFRDGGTKGASGAHAPSDNEDQSTLSQQEWGRLCPPLKYSPPPPPMAFQTFRHL
jgi:hypothetical protein